MNNELTIVIPAKNEEKYIGNLLRSIEGQDYRLIRQTPVFVAIAPLTNDHTEGVIKNFEGRLNIKIIEGGSVASGRNAGAIRTQSDFILFLDADVELGDPNLITRAIGVAREKKLYCVAVNIWCKNKDSFPANILYGLNNIAQKMSVLNSPYSSGMFLLISKSQFDALGGFNEKVFYAEDYYFTRQIERHRFGVVKGCIFTSDRRFKKTGYVRIFLLFLKICTASLLKNDRVFFKDRHYWD